MEFLVFSLKYSQFDEIRKGNQKYIIKKKKYQRNISDCLIYVKQKGFYARFQLSQNLTGEAKDIFDEIKFYITIPEAVFFKQFPRSKTIYAYEVNRAIFFKKPLNPFDLNIDFRPNTIAYVKLKESLLVNYY